MDNNDDLLKNYIDSQKRQRELIEESKKNNISKKDILLSLSFLSLCHSIIEDTILILLLGSHISGILFFRMIYTIVIILFMKYLLDTKLENKILDKLTYD